MASSKSYKPFQDSSDDDEADTTGYSSICEKSLSSSSLSQQDTQRTPQPKPRPPKKAKTCSTGKVDLLIHPKRVELVEEEDDTIDLLGTPKSPPIGKNCFFFCIFVLFFYALEFSWYALSDMLTLSLCGRIQFSDALNLVTP